MTPQHRYLARVLEKQWMDNRNSVRLKSIRDQIRSDLKPINRYNPRIYNGGSYGKKTMIREAFDLDLVIYFPHTDSRSLKEMYTSVYDSLEHAGYKMTPSQVALTLKPPNNPFPKDFHVDVVTGKALDERFDYAYIYDILKESRIRTNLKMHIDNVCEVRDVIKLMKLWIRRHSLNWQTFAMEQTVVRALKNQNTRDLGQCMENVLIYIKSSISQLHLIDPANSNDHIEIPKKIRLAIEQKANHSFKALQNGDWESIVW
ncbi:nucleotidyltransferase [Candidatus Parabeggiatoa sp. HSG14]|uniref:nucleotidyltransferase domain-containing protein n=1 Tax=Candidatus Parabeggiatoa sp. HSG14 TaxID=3055593 RepID=UPI0032E47178